MDVGSLRALFAVHYFKTDLLTFGKRLETITCDGAEMNENIFAFVRRNETIPLAIVKPLYRSLTHPKTAS